MWGKKGQNVHLDCKVLFILQEIVPVSKRDTSPCSLLSFIVLQDSILHVFTFIWLLPECS